MSLPCIVFTKVPEVKYRSSGIEIACEDGGGTDSDGSSFSPNALTQSPTIDDRTIIFLAEIKHDTRARIFARHSDVKKK